MARQVPETDQASIFTLSICFSLFLPLLLWRSVLRRNPVHENAWLAWIDAETWAGKKDPALLLKQKAPRAIPNSENLNEKKTKLLATAKH